MEDIQSALDHFRGNTTLVLKFGKNLYGHPLFLFDDGERYLVKCNKCGGYILIQDFERRSYSDGNDTYYTDYFPVDGPKEADFLNQMYGGWSIEFEFVGKWIANTDDSYCWKVGRRLR